MEKRDSRNIFTVLVSAFDELDLLLEKMIDICFLESKASVFSSYEYSIQSAFKAFRGAYNVLITYARDILVGDDKQTVERLDIIERKHKRLVYQRGRFEHFLKVCRMNDGDEITLFDFGEGFAIHASFKKDDVKELK